MSSENVKEHIIVGKNHPTFDVFPSLVPKDSR